VIDGAIALAETVSVAAALVTDPAEPPTTTLYTAPLSAEVEGGVV
jgi:hypothetical protein